MPYAPGIQDISGQLLGEGMTRASNIRAQARSDFGKTISDTLIGGIKQYQQNESFTQQSLAKFYSNMQDPDYKDLVTKIISDDSNQMGVPSNLKKAIQNAGTGKIDAGQAAMLATWAQDFSERKNAVAKTKQVDLQNQHLQAEIDQQKALADYVLRMPPEESVDTRSQAANAARFIPSAAEPSTQQFLPAATVFGTSASPVANVNAPVAQQIKTSKYTKRPYVSDIPASETPVTSSIQPSEAVLPSPVASSLPIVTAAQPIDQYMALRPSDVSFAPAALAASRFAGPIASVRSVQPASASAPASVAVPAPSLDPLALELARQRFDTGISSPSEQFTLPQIKLSPEARDIARRLREQYDDSAAVLERRAATPRLTAGEDEGKAGSLKKKKTITLDEEGIKAILSNPRILVESFGDVMGDPYERAMRNEATDAAFRRNAQMRELERQFGVRTPARRGK
jgi:hypothetical protein